MSDLLLVIVFGIMQGSIYAAVALGLVLVFGVTDIVNFAHSELVTFGAFGIILLTPLLGFSRRSRSPWPGWGSSRSCSTTSDSSSPSATTSRRWCSRSAWC